MSLLKLAGQEFQQNKISLIPFDVALKTFAFSCSPNVCERGVQSS